jgi:hypothetical protein
MQHRGTNMVFGILGALVFMVLALWSMSRPSDPANAPREERRSVRSLYLQSVTESQQGDPIAAERHLRAALAQLARPDATRDDRDLELSVRSSLAGLLASQQRDGEAREVAAPACRMGPDGGAPTHLAVTGLCDR